MHNLLQRHGKLLSIGLSVVCSVLLVAVVVSAATTIGANISTDGNATITGTLGVTGKSTLGNTSSTIFTAFQGLYVGGTATSSIDSAGNASVAGNATITGTLGVTGLSTLGKASSSLVSSYGDFYVGRTATTTISGSSTSTFATSVILNESGANTSTLQIGHTTTTKGQGGCIALAADDGTVLYLMVTSVNSRYELVTSTAARDCGY